MILSMLRFFVLGIIVMSIAYLLVSFYITSTLRENLEAEWEARPQSGRGTSKVAWVDARLRQSRGAVRWRAFLISFVIPSFSVLAILIAVNFL